MSVDPKKFGITPSLVDAVKLTLEGKSLAALAPPRDKVTHKDVLVGRGVLKKHPQDPDKHVVAKEEAEQVDETHKPGDRVKIVKGRHKGIEGHIGEIRRPLGEPKRYVVYHGDHGATEVEKEHIRKIKEEVEQVDELSKGTLGSYVKKASGRVADKSRHAGDIENRRDISPAAKEVLARQNRKIGNSLKGISRATDRLTKEDVEQVDELSKGTLGSYVKKASDDARARARIAGTAGPGTKRGKELDDKSRDRVKHIGRAIGKLTKEETEQVDELSKKTLGSYVNKAAGSAATHTGAAAAYGSSSKNPNAAKMAQHQAIATKRTAGIQKAVGKLTKEDVEHVAEADVKNAGPKVKDEYKNFHDKFKSHSKENQAKITSNLRKGMSYKDAIKNVSEADGSSNPSTSSSALDKINSIATDMKKMASEPLKAPKDPGAVKKLPNVNAPGAPSMFKTEAVADPMAAKKAEVQKKIAQKQATAVQARANKRMSNINASNDKCSCGSTNESKMKCEVHGDSGMKGGKEKIEVNPPLREAEDLPKKVITKGHEIAKSLIKNRAKVREPYAVGMATAKKSAGIKN
jgi:hypothetical protein